VKHNAPSDARSDSCAYLEMTDEEQRYARVRAVRFHNAVALDDAASVDALLRDGFSVETRDADGNTALHNAASGGKLAVLQHLLSWRADGEALTEDGQRTALHEACTSGELEAVNILLAAGVNLNAKDEYGETPLFKAASAGEDAVVRALLASPEGADRLPA